MLKGIDHIAITVTDRDKTVKFFKEILGLQVSSSFYDQGEKSQIVFLKCPEEPGVAQVEILAPDNPPAEKGLTHLAFLVDNIEEVYNKLKSQGVQFEFPVAESAGLKYTYFRGPQGVILEIIQRPAK